MKKIVLGSTVAVVAVLLVIGVVVWRTVASGIHAGSVIDVDELASPADSVRFEVPNASYSLAFTTALSALPRDAIVSSPDQGDEVKAGVAGGGRFVGLDLARVVRPGIPDEVTAVSGSAAPTLALVADGRRYTLPSVHDLLDPSEAVYVALPGTPRTLDVEVTFDGTTQRIGLGRDDADHAAAAPYYAPTSLALGTQDLSRCTSARVRLSAGQLDPGPSASSPHLELPGPILDVPYAAGHGWAPAGRSWLVLPLTTRFDVGTFVSWPRFGAPHEALYLPKLRRTTITVDGATAATTVPYYGQGSAELTRQGVSGGYYVFSVADPADTAHTVRFSQLYSDHLDSRDRPAPSGAPRTIIGRVSCSFHVDG
ncbi:hypothetical protein GCM10028801_39530 [Nocardioides maradonensis]